MVRLREAYFLAIKEEKYVIKDNQLADIFSGTLITNARGKAIKAKTVGQKRYVEAILRDDVVFSIGPAGTGKTYLAVAMAVRALRNNCLLYTSDAADE